MIANVKKLDNWITAPEVAELLNVSRSRVHQLVVEGKIPEESIRYVGVTEKKVYIFCESFVNTLAEEKGTKAG